MSEEMLDAFEEWGSWCRVYGAATETGRCVAAAGRMMDEAYERALDIAYGRA